MNYETIYNSFLSRVKDRHLLKLSDADYDVVMHDYMINAISLPYIHKIFKSLAFDEEERTLSYRLYLSNDDNTDENFVLDVITKGMVIEWMSQKIDTDLTLSIAIGGKEEKVLKNNLKENQERLHSLQVELGKTIRDYGVFNGSYWGR